MSTPDEIRVRHILVEHEYEARDLEKKLNEGVSFEALAQKFSRCPSKSQGGDLGFFGRGRMVEAFEDAAFSLEIDEVSPPVRTRFGYHIIQRLS